MGETPYRRRFVLQAYGRIAGRLPWTIGPSASFSASLRLICSQRA